MNILRRISTRALVLSLLVVAAVSAASAYAVSTRSGPKPPARPLAAAIHGSLAGTRLPGVTARISFTDHLFPSDSLGGSSSSLLSGATGRLWIGGGRARIELQGSNGDTEIAVTKSGVTVYDVSSGTAYRLPFGHAGSAPTTASPHARQAPPSLTEIRSALAEAARHVSLSGAIPGNIGGRPSYSVRISPRHDGGLLGAVELGWDAARAVPLKIALYSQGQSSPVLALAVTNISYGPVPASDLQVTPAPGTRIVTVRRPASGSGPKSAEVTGFASVAQHLPFALHAPRSLVGVPRQAIRLVNWGGKAAALAVYGRGLGAVLVLEQQAAGRPLLPAALPTVSIDGASGRELATALGTVLQFDRQGVRYTVIGSLPAAAAEAAARAVS
jgi:hypothetical protein